MAVVATGWDAGQEMAGGPVGWHPPGPCFGAPATLAETVADRLTVFYDADCGMCTMTARMLRILDTARRLQLTPLQRFVPAPPDDPGRAALLARLHVRDARGRWHAGADAVLEIAAAIPLLVPLSLVGRLPGLRRMVGAGYEVVARNRDAIGRRLGVDRCRIDPDRLA